MKINPAINQLLGPEKEHVSLLLRNANFSTRTRVYIVPLLLQLISTVLQGAEAINRQITFRPSDAEIGVNFTVEDDSVALERTEVLEWDLALARVVDRVFLGVRVTVFNITDDDGMYRA